MGQISFTDLQNGVIPDASDFNDRFNALKSRINNGMEADNIANTSITGAKMVNNTVTALQLDETDDFTWTGTHSFTGATVTGAYTATAANALAGSVVQVVNVQSGTKATAAATFPDDDTVPLISEGAEIMTKAITFTSATNKFLVRVVAMVASGSNGPTAVALFNTDIHATEALAVSASRYHDSSGQPETVSFEYFGDSPGVAETTFRVRMGTNSGNAFFNSDAGVNDMWGAAIKSSITITEIKV